MLYSIASVLIVVWLFGLVSGYAMGAFVHVLLVIAAVIICAKMMSRRKPMQEEQNVRKDLV